MDLFKMMGKARELQGRMGELQEELKSIEASGKSGAGSVKATMNGTMVLTALTIDPELMKPDEKEIVEDLVMAAIADAQSKVQALAQERTQILMDDLGLPPGMKLPFGA